jgi:hypothetical protein
LLAAAIEEKELLVNANHASTTDITHKDVDNPFACYGFPVRQMNDAALYVRCVARVWVD